MLADAVLARADLLAAKLVRADLCGADLGGARLTGANLDGADLTGADLTDADLAGANLGSAELARAELTGALWPVDGPVPAGWERHTGSGQLVAAGTGARGHRQTSHAAELAPKALDMSTKDRQAGLSPLRSGHQALSWELRSPRGAPACALPARCAVMLLVVCDAARCPGERPAPSSTGATCAVGQDRPSCFHTARITAKVPCRIFRSSYAWPTSSPNTYSNNRFAGVGHRAAAGAMASHGQGAVDRADGDDFGTKVISQESQGGFSLACVHVRVHSPRVQRDCDLAAGIARIRCLPGGWHQMALFVRCRLAWAAAPGGEDVASRRPPHLRTCRRSVS